MAYQRFVITGDVRLDTTDAVKSSERLSKQIRNIGTSIDGNSSSKMMKLTYAMQNADKEAKKLAQDLKSMRGTQVESPIRKETVAAIAEYNKKYDETKQKMLEAKRSVQEYRKEFEIGTENLGKYTAKLKEIKGNDYFKTTNEGKAQIEGLERLIAQTKRANAEAEKGASKANKEYEKQQTLLNDLNKQYAKYIENAKKLNSGELSSKIKAEDSDEYKQKEEQLNKYNQARAVMVRQYQEQEATEAEAAERTRQREERAAEAADNNSKAFRTLAFSIRYAGTIGNRIIPGFSKMLTPISAGLRLAARGGDELKASFAALKPVLIEALSVIGPIVAALAAISLAIKVLVGYLKLLFGTMVKLVQLAYKEMMALIKVLGLLGKGFTKLIGLLGKGIVSGLGLAVKGFKNLATAIWNFNLKLIDTAKSIFHFLTGINGISGALRWLKSTITSIIPTIAQMNGGANSVNQAMSMLVSSLTQMKNAWGAAFTPILTTVAPLLNYLIQLITKVAETIGAFFSALTGKPFIKAKKLNIDYAKSLDNSAKSTKNLKDETEELLGKLGDYDELSVIGEDKKDNKVDTPDAGGGGLSADDMFEVADIPQSIKDWVEELKKAWANEDWGWFYDQGFKAAEWLANMLDKAVEWMDTKGMEYARKIALALANFLNGAFANLHLARSIGETIGSAFNIGLEFAYNFLKTFDFFQFGRFISTGLMTAIKKIDWGKLGTTIALGINGLFDTVRGILDAWDTDAIVNAFDKLINNLIVGIKWAENGKILSNAIYKVFDTAAKAIKGIRWSDLGRDFGDFLNNQSWGKQLDAIGRAIANLLNGINLTIESFLQKKPFEKIAKGLGYAITNLFSGKNAINFERIGSNIAEIINQIFGMFGKFAESFKGGEVGEAIGRGINSMFENLDPSTAAKNVSDFIMDVLRTATGALREANLPKLGTKLGEFFADINWAEILDKVAVGIRMFLTDVAQFGINFIDSGGFGDFATSLGNAFNSIFGDTNMWSKIGELVGKSLSALGEMLVGLVSGEEGNKLAEGLDAFFTGVTDNMDGAKLAEGISGLISTALTELQEFLSSDDAQAVSDALDNILNQALQLVPWDKLVDTLVNYLGPALVLLSLKLQIYLTEAGANIIKGLLGGIQKLWDDIPTWIKVALELLITLVKVALGIASPSKVFEDIGINIVQGLLDGLASLKEDLLQWWEDIKTAIHEKVEALKEGVRQKWEEMKSRVEEVMLTLKTSIEEKWNAFKDKIIEVATTIKDTVVSKWEEFKSKLEGIWTAIKSTVESVWNGIKSVITGVISTVGAAITNFVNGVITAVEKVKGAMQSLGGMGLGGAIGGILTKAQSAAKNSGQSDDWARRHRFMPEAMATMAMMNDLGLGNEIVTSPLQRFYENAIPLATGAVIPPNREFAAILGDQRSGVNIETPLQTMIDAFNTALAQNGLAGGGGNQQPIVLQLNGKTIAQAVWDEEEKQYKQNIRR